MTTHAKFDLSRCPDDILKCIFEFAVENEVASSDAFHIATIISHTCHHWRIIALHTPRIWRRVIIDLYPRKEMTIEIFQTHWDSLRTRIKSAPADISIFGIGSEDSIPLELCQLSDIPVISRLCFSLEGPRAKKEIEQLSLSTRSVMELLTFDLDEDREGKSHYLGNTLAGLPPTQKIHLTGGGRVIFETQRTYSSVRRISADRLIYIDTGVAFIAFPQLEFVEVTDSGYPYKGPPSVLPHLKSLQVRNLYPPSWLSSFTAPNLEIFHVVQGYDVEQGAIDFILAHPSITTLSLEMYEGISQLVIGAPQLQHLAICHGLYTRNKSHFRHQYFPALQTLTLTIDSLGFLLTPEDFEYVVCARCLPSTHPRSELPSTVRPLESLTIVSHHLRNVVKSDWTQSTLYYEAMKTEDYNDTEKRICLSWVS